MCVSLCLMVFLLVASSLHCRKVWWTIWIHERTHLSAYSMHVCLSSQDVMVQGSYILGAPSCIYSRPSVLSVRLTSGLWPLVSNIDLCCWGWSDFPNTSVQLLKEPRWCSLWRILSVQHKMFACLRTNLKLCWNMWGQHEYTKHQCEH